MKITNREKKPMLEREEISGTIEFKDAVPSRKDVQKKLAKETNSKEELIVVKSIYTDYGETTAEISAFIYKNEDALKNTEKKYMVNRHSEKKKEEAPVAPAPAEAPAAEATPAEGGEEKAEEAKEAPAEESKAEENVEEKPAEPEKKEEPKAEEAKEEKPAEAEKKEE